MAMLWRCSGGVLAMFWRGSWLTCAMIYAIMLNAGCVAALNF